MVVIAMDEYIKREDALRQVLLVEKRTNMYKCMKNIPAADVRPVVRCRDCIHFQQFRPHDGFCKIDGMLWNNDFFCANGKREES